MPFKSEAQRRLLWSKHPAIARRWAHKYGNTPKPATLKKAAKKRIKRA